MPSHDGSSSEFPAADSARPRRSDQRRRRRQPRTTFVLAVVAGLLAVSTVVLASDRFADSIAPVHQPGVSFVADAGVTTGCGDGTIFCPNDPVTRQQMATFLYRLSGHAPGIDPSVNAAELDGHTADDLKVPAELLPIAHGRIGTGGEAIHGTGNFTGSWNSTFNRYEIAIDDVNYHVNTHSTLVTPICNDYAVVRTTSAQGSLTVDYSGGVQCQFAFVVYASPS